MLARANIPALDEGEFRANGGYKRLDKVFDGKLENVLQQISEQIWTSALL